jgi:hypothetical protein
MVEEVMIRKVLVVGEATRPGFEVSRGTMETIDNLPEVVADMREGVDRQTLEHQGIVLL